MNNHTTKMRMPNTHIFLSRSAIKYAVNIYQALPNNTSRRSGAGCSPCETIGAFGGYQTLPSVTMGPIWLYPCLVRPLPGPLLATYKNNYTHR